MGQAAPADVGDPGPGAGSANQRSRPHQAARCVVFGGIRERATRRLVFVTGG
jgi:hypothetical protein